MSVTTAELAAWLAAPEVEHLEFQEARNHFDFEELVTVEGKTKAARWFPGPAADKGARA